MKIKFWVDKKESTNSDLEDQAAIFLEEMNISGDTMVQMNHHLDDIPKDKIGAYYLNDLMAGFVREQLNLYGLKNLVCDHGWVSIEEAQPKPQQRVYVVCENPKYDSGGVIRFQTMAEYIPYMTVKEEDYMADEYAGDGDYNEEEDEYYTPEGFYEWQSEPEMHWKISAKVTHWMPLIALP